MQGNYQRLELRRHLYAYVGFDLVLEGNADVFLLVVVQEVISLKQSLKTL
jgi:hypothetical protein